MLQPCGHFQYPFANRPDPVVSGSQTSAQFRHSNRSRPSEPTIVTPTLANSVAVHRLDRMGSGIVGTPLPLKSRCALATVDHLSQILKLSTVLIHTSKWHRCIFSIPWLGTSDTDFESPQNSRPLPRPGLGGQRRTTPGRGRINTSNQARFLTRNNAERIFVSPSFVEHSADLSKDDLPV